MRDDQQQFLNLRGHWPARLTAEQTAWVLNCEKHNIPSLVQARLLKPLGNPAANGVKFFATIEVMELAKDRHWLAKMTQIISQHWQKKNASRRNLASASPAEIN